MTQISLSLGPRLSFMMSFSGFKVTLNSPTPSRRETESVRRTLIRTTCSWQVCIYFACADTPGTCITVFQFTLMIFQFCL